MSFPFLGKKKNDFPPLMNLGKSNEKKKKNRIKEKSMFSTNNVKSGLFLFVFLIVTNLG